MVPPAFNREVVRKYWLVNDAMRSLALDRIEPVEFAGNNTHRQHVQWERGTQVWVNRGAAAPWAVEGRTLPQYGCYLRGPQVEAAVELRDGARVEWSRGPGGRYEAGRFTRASGEVLELPAAH